LALQVIKFEMVGRGKT